MKDLAKLNHAIDEAKELLDDLNKIATATAGTSTAAGELRFDFDGAPAAKIDEVIEKPVPSDELAKNIGTLKLYHERMDNLGKLIDSLKAHDDAAEQVKQAEDIKSQLDKAYEAAKKATNALAMSGFPQTLRNMIEDAEEDLAKYYKFDPSKGSAKTKHAFVWFNGEDAFYGATLTLRNLRSADSDKVEYQTYTFCFAAPVRDNGSLSLYLRGDAGDTLPFKGTYAKANSFTTDAEMYKLLYKELELDHVTKTLTKVDMPILPQELDQFKDVGPHIKGVTMPNAKTLLVQLDVPPSDKDTVNEAVTAMRLALSAIFGPDVQKKNVVRHTITGVDGDEKATQIKFEMVRRPSVSGNRPKDLLNRLKTIRHELGLDNGEYETLVKFVRNHVE